MRSELLRAAAVCPRRLWFLAAGIVCDGEGLMPGARSDDGEAAFVDGLLRVDAERAHAVIRCPSSEMDGAALQAAYVARALRAMGVPVRTIECVDETGETAAVFTPNGEEECELERTVLPAIERTAAFPAPPPRNGMAPSCSRCPVAPICRA
ncbi:MAG: hypothetical protein QHI48_06075 [Bacteroidota bacterium]|nr:hypothetical protein [Bacteroidota bacterium]